MSLDQQLIDSIKQNLARKSYTHLVKIAQSEAQGHWSSEAIAAAREILQDRLSGLAEEPEIPEPEDEPPEFHYEPADVALGMLAGLLSGLSGHLVMPFHRKVEVKDPDLPLPFGQQMAWLSLDTTDPAAAARALNLREVRGASWEDGVEWAHGGLIYVTPPIGDWTMALGTPLFQTPETLKPLMENLSRKFEDVQYFCNHREIGMYAWARARQGKIVRGYCWLGSRSIAVWDEGLPSEEEIELGLSCGAGQPPTVESDGEDSGPLTEDFVLELASLWSIDPTTLDDEYKEPVMGLLGKLDRAESDDSST